MGIVTDMFVDWNRLKGQDARHRIPELQQVIMSPDFSFEALLSVFLPSAKRGGGGAGMRK